MNTEQLPSEISNLKKDLTKRVSDFNTATGLFIGGIIIEGVYAEESVGEFMPVVKQYKVSVNIEL
jgi:hypothetical protein